MKTLRKRAALAATVALAAMLATATTALHAETSDVSSAGFTVTQAMAVESDPQKVWLACTQLPLWWNGAHTRSGQASTLSLDATAAAGGRCSDLCHRAPSRRDAPASHLPRGGRARRRAGQACIGGRWRDRRAGHAAENLHRNRQAGLRARERMGARRPGPWTP